MPISENPILFCIYFCPLKLYQFVSVFKTYVTSEKLHQNDFVTTPTQIKTGVDMKMTLHTTHHQHTQQYLSCYWSDFHQIFKVGFLDQQQQHEQEQEQAGAELCQAQV